MSLLFSEEMRRLVDLLNKAGRAYYTLDAPIMSDAEYDSAYNRLLELERTTGIILPDSPSHKVGGEILEAFLPHRHLTRLWSLDKAQNENELDAWFDRTEKSIQKIETLPSPTYGIEYKFDGLTLNLTYENGILTQAATRGNGITGEAILPQAKTVEGVPLSIPWKGTLEVQGECIMRLSSLEKYNKTSTEPLKNARNAAAGALRNLDPKVTASRHLNAYFYQVSTIENPPFHDQDGMITFLKDQGFPISPYFFHAKNRDEAKKAVSEIEASRPSLDFLIDGAVIKIQDQNTRDVLGYTDKFPRWAVAYKFAAEENTAELERVTWELGRTGRVTPLAHISPVDFSGVTVRKATLNNYSDIVRKKLRLHTQVWIRRSNDVIPEIMGCVDENENGEEILPPTLCPSCGKLLTFVGPNLYCLNRDGCKPQAVMRIKHFASRDAMDISTLSEKTAELLYDCLSIRTAADLYSLSFDQLLSLDGFQEKKAQNMLNALEKSKHCTLSAFLFAIGIPGIGKRTARDLASHFGSFENVRSSSYEALIEINDIGDIVAQNILEFFSLSENNNMIDDLLKAGVQPQAEESAPKDASGVFSGKTFVLTGTLPTLTRAEAEALILAAGGNVSGSVSKKTSYVLYGENPGSKLEKAIALGIDRIDEESFRNMLNAAEQ